MSGSRICKLEECGKDISHLNSRARYCCVSHSDLCRKRKSRKSKLIPYVLTGEICPIDGQVFPVELFKNYGNRKYDCKSCAAIAKKIRECLKPEVPNRDSSTVKP